MEKYMPKQGGYHISSTRSDTSTSGAPAETDARTYRQSRSYLSKPPAIQTLIRRLYSVTKHQKVIVLQTGRAVSSLHRKADAQCGE